MIIKTFVDKLALGQDAGQQAAEAIQQAIPQFRKGPRGCGKRGVAVRVS